LRDIDAGGGIEQVGVRAKATGADIDDLGKSADSSKSVLANMIGNSVQDLGALGGVAGSAGVAIGQMGEYMADARAEGESFSSILRNFGSVAGPIAAVSVGLAAVNDIMKAMAEGQAATKAFDTEQIKQFTDAVKEGTDITKAYAAELEQTGKVLADTGIKGGPAWTQILPPVAKLTESLGLMGRFGDTIEDILPLLNTAGVSAQIWTDVITSAKPVQSMDKLRAALDKTNISDDDRSKILIAARAAQDNYNDSVANGVEVNKFFTETVRDDTDARRAGNAQMERYLELLERRHGEAEQQQRNADATDRYVDALARLNTEEERVDRARHLKEEETNARALISVYDELLGKLSVEGRRLAIVAAFERAKEQIASGNLSLVEAGVLLNNLKQDAARYGEALKLPKETIVPIVAEIDTLALDKAQSDLLGLTTPITVPVVPQWAQSSLPGLPSFLRAPTPTSVVNNTVINPPGTPAATVDLFNIFVTRNGDRTQL
jgi:hypothetical protein